MPGYPDGEGGEVIPIWPPLTDVKVRLIEDTEALVLIEYHANEVRNLSREGLPSTVEEIKYHVGRLNYFTSKLHFPPTS